MWPFLAKKPRKLFSYFCLQTALYAETTLKFSVNILGIPAGYAFYKEKPKEECIIHKKQVCELHVYLIKLNWDILKNLQILSYVWLNEKSQLDFNKFLIQRENEKNEIQIFYNLEKSKWQILTNGILLHEISGNEQVHTLASLPLYIKKQSPHEDGEVQVILQNEIRILKYQVWHEGNFLKIKHEGQDYIVFRTPDWLPEYIRVLPIRIFGIELGEISATRIP